MSSRSSAGAFAFRLTLATSFLLVAGCTNDAVTQEDASTGDLAIANDAAAIVDLSRRGDLGPCGGPCTGDTPYCDVQSGRCVACRNDGDCPAGAVCHAGACERGCSAQHGCGDAGLCEVDAGRCVVCRDDGDCPAGHYCAIDQAGNTACLLGCRTDVDCLVGDAGAGAACCAHQCVNTTSDRAHCGRCDIDCGAAPDAACCAGRCTMTGTDVTACGGCGRICAFANAGAMCNAGACALGICNAGFADCDKDQGNGCEASIGSDVRNCSGCGMACAVPNGQPACLVGVCSLGSCNPGFRNCDGLLNNGCEVNSAVDPKNCGACGSACAQLPNAMATCANSACVVASCSMGFGNCDKQDANGCETDLSSSLAHCGQCGNACPAPPNVVIACNGGKCQLLGCAKDYTDCDNNLANGCEAKLPSDPKNCGACGKVCPGAANNQIAACINGACSLTCAAGWGDCDGNAQNGCELDVSADPKNCGACANVCPQNLPVCKAGQCQAGCNYAADVLALSPIGYWPLDEMNGPTAFDKAAAPHNGTVQGNPQYGGGGVAGTSWLFHGNNDHVRMAAVTSKTTTEVSYEVWVKIAANPGSAMTIFWDDDAQGGGDAWLEITPAGKLQARRSPDGFVDFLSNASLTLGVWNHVVFVCDAGGKRFYLNGALDSSTPTLMNSRTNRSYVTLGANYDGNFFPGGAQYFNGSIDEFAIYGRALTANEIATHYADACGK